MDSYPLPFLGVRLVVEQNEAQLKSEKIRKNTPGHETP